MFSGLIPVKLFLSAKTLITPGYQLVNKHKHASHHLKHTHISSKTFYFKLDSGTHFHSLSSQSIGWLWSWNMYHVEYNQQQTSTYDPDSICFRCKTWSWSTSLSSVHLCIHFRQQDHFDNKAMVSLPVHQLFLCLLQVQNHVILQTLKLHGATGSAKTKNSQSKQHLQDICQSGCWLFGGGWWLLPRLRGFWENVWSFFPHLHLTFFFFFTWKLAHAH